MGIILKKMETADEIKEKAYVHWKSWHEACTGIVSQENLDKLTLEKYEKKHSDTVRKELKELL